MGNINIITAAKFKRYITLVQQRLLKLEHPQIMTSLCFQGVAHGRDLQNDPFRVLSNTVGSFWHPFYAGKN